jgi:uncharacterized coiled-coil DUF342 family protein
MDTDRLMKQIEDLADSQAGTRMKMAELFDQLREASNIITSFLKQHDKAGK